MVNFQKVSAFGIAEIRLTRRLIRYWLFILISYLIALLTYFIYSVIHGTFSSYSATAALFNPRFLLGTIGLDCLLAYTAGTIFLGFDIRARDRRDQILEVLDSHPYTNLELVSGKFIGLLVVTWIPIITLALLLQALGLILPSPLGETLEIHSLITFIFLMALPALALTLSIVFLVTLLVKNRLAAAAVLIVLAAIVFQGISSLTTLYSPLADITGSWIISSPSEIIPCLADFSGWMHSIGILGAALSIIIISSSVHLRLDGGSRIKTAAGGITLFLISLGISGFVFYNSLNTIERINIWKKAHSEYSTINTPDLCSVSGNIRIEPGKNMELDIDLVFRAPPHKAITKALFTLNPGQKIISIYDASGKSLSFIHENGLLEITLPEELKPDEEKKISMSINGIPDNRFGYLYSAVNTENMTPYQKNISILGLKKSIFDSRFITLMPGVRWLPMPGSEKDRNDPRKVKTDYFDVDLKVDLPSEWLAAGPGKRIRIENKNSSRVLFRFSPGAPVPEVAMIASKFKSLSFEVEGITMEMLMTPGHMKNVELFSDTGNKIYELIQTCLKEAEEYGLEYPYNGLTLAEVPASLRCYGGGWRMDTAMAPPGILLMRETSFPTASFKWPLRKPETFKDKEGGLVQAKWEILKTFFLNDLSGGNIFTGASRNFFLHQTGTSGDEAVALNYVMENLASEIITETTPYFSAHNYTAEDVMGPVMSALTFSKQNDSASGTTMSEEAVEIVKSDPEVWDYALKESLIDMDPWKDPEQKNRVLILKAGAIARSIIDTLGHEKTAELLASILKSYKGNTFTYKDMIRQGEDMGIDLNKLFKNMLESTALPGFICSEVKAYRIPDTKDGFPRYQLIIDVRNDEKAPGMFYFRYRFNNSDRQEWIKSKPVFIDGESAVRLGVVLSQVPDAVWFEPFLSLNRKSFMIHINKTDHENITDTEPIEGLINLTWTKPESSFVTADNMDNNFEIIDGTGKKKVLKGRRTASIHLGSEGFSSWSGFIAPSEWTILDLPGNWGRYQHNAAVVQSGEGNKKAIFIVMIPKAGSWDLELHMPDLNKSFPGLKFGRWPVQMLDSSGNQHELIFESGSAVEGWNMAGTVELTEGEVSVILTDKSDIGPVIADAVRWSPSIEK